MFRAIHNYKAILIQKTNTCIHQQRFVCVPSVCLSQYLIYHIPIHIALYVVKIKSFHVIITNPWLEHGGVLKVGENGPSPSYIETCRNYSSQLYPIHAPLPCQRGATCGVRYFMYCQCNAIMSISVVTNTNTNNIPKQYFEGSLVMLCVSHPVI